MKCFKNRRTCITGVGLKRLIHVKTIFLYYRVSNRGAQVWLECVGRQLAAKVFGLESNLALRFYGSNDVFGGTWRQQFDV